VIVIEPLHGPEAPELRVAAGIPGLEDVDTTTEGSDPQAPAHIGEQRGDVPGSERGSVCGLGQNSLDATRFEIETVEAVLRSDPEGIARAPGDHCDALVREAVYVFGMVERRLYDAERQRPQPIE